MPQKKENILNNKRFLMTIIVLIIILLIDPISRLTIKRGVFIDCPETTFLNSSEKCCLGCKEIDNETVCRYNDYLKRTYQEDKSISTNILTGGVKLCARCGNDICEENEGPCNCPEDCKMEIYNIDY